MIKRYKAGKYLPACYFLSNTQTASTTLTLTYSAVIKCAPHATINTLVNFSSSSGGTAFYKINTNNYVSGDTPSFTDTGSGTITLTIELGFTSGSTGQHLNVYLNMTSVSIGVLSSSRGMGDSLGEVITT